MSLGLVSTAVRVSTSLAGTPATVQKASLGTLAIVSVSTNGMALLTDSLIHLFFGKVVVCGLLSHTFNRGVFSSLIHR